MANKKNHRFLKGTLAAGTILGGAALNVPVVQHIAGEYRQYQTDTNQADSAQAEANEAVDPSTLAIALIRTGYDKERTDRQALFDAAVDATPAERDALKARITEDEKLIDDGNRQLLEAQKNAVNPDHQSPQDKASLLRVKADEDLDDIKRTGLELAALDGGLAFGLKKLLDARKRNKVNSCLEGIEAREHRNRAAVDSHLERYEAEMTDFLKGDRSF